VRQTENQFARWGILALLFGKFVPGMATVGPPLAGAMGIGAARFLAYTALGGLIWVGVMVGAGAVFHTQITALLDRLEAIGMLALQIVGVLLALFIAIKWWERRRFYKTLRLARITAEELRSLMDKGTRPVVVDVRSSIDREADGRYIPGALAIDLAELDRRRGELPAELEIVFYCSCPNEASAAVAARRFMEVGYSRGRPLAGVLEGWAAAGFPVERRGA